MLAITTTGAVLGIDGVTVTVEVASERGLPTFHIIGLGDTIVKESADRVRGAIINSGYDYPRGRVTVNLSPAWIRKKGSHFDLPMAVGILAAENIIRADSLSGKAFIGELNLIGDIRPVRGILPMVAGLAGQVDELYLAEGNCREGYLAAKGTGIKVIPVKTLRALEKILNGRTAKVPYIWEEPAEALTEELMDFADVKGHEAAKDAIVTAVSGGHGLLLIGSPGTGKTMLAKRIPTVLPDMTFEEQLETSKVYSLIGKLDEKTPIITQRPFRQLNKRHSPAGILGGGSQPLPGEISLAHNGILCIDEFLEFGRDRIELLRKPMEEREIRLMRRGEVFTFPAAFTLIGATNPCPCGYLGDEDHACHCTQTEIDRYRNRLSGPLCERIDMCVEIRRVEHDAFSGSRTVSSAQMRKKVIRTRQIQEARFEGMGIKWNSQMEERHIKKFCRLDEAGQQFMKMAYEKQHLSPRRYHKILRLARTMADIQESPDIQLYHLAGALQYTRFFDDRY